ncbi:MAG: serine--tRNA ligase [Candidatus Niyogibacteria bacterium RIFCSPLOWO2_12_FULL_41_13]|uniref:Serine--tRNA ligase n=1 Tax=Candidatus Niyogibacteria bacterium RIFCSPLOWO2_12_FULL_41_13 TaxID=1801726 RepID=A0A1G2F128_9BACT|nr:MAG: serine--tRNA ligase [Candidatus Niyogibacteria bacterium RIFCSPLOWO2_12_FULL_41_13]
MLDIKFIRQNSELVREAIRKKYIDLDLNRLLDVDEKRLELLKEIEGLRAKQNKLAGEIAGLKGEERDAKIGESKNIKKNLQEKEGEYKKIEEEFNGLMLKVPNIPDPSVPEGKDESFNQEIRKWGEKPTFDFPAKDYLNIMEQNGWLDLERGVKVSGFRGYFLKGKAALLSMAIWKFVVDELVKKGFEPVLAPSLARKENFVGTGWLPSGEKEIYQMDDMGLVGTSEVSMMGYHKDEILKEEELPKKYVAFSPCFRKEAGAYGKDTKGILRVHEFYKVEQVILCKADHQESVKWHEELTKNAEELNQKLGLHYRAVICSTGETGLGQVKKYDIETWIPSENKYRETHSSSYFHDFQTRRLNIRYRAKDGELYFAHSLNNTAIATPRILIAIIEQRQQKDGTFKLPEILEKYL